jgi:hypothetical protein
MDTIVDLKDTEVPGTPLFLFDCVLPSSDVLRWSTHAVSFNGQPYAARVLKHNAFDLSLSSDDGTGGVSKVSLTLANADSLLSGVESDVGWKGSQLTVTFLFYDLLAGQPTSDSQVMFRGIANPPDLATESSLRLSFTSRLNLTRIYLPETKITKRCPWMFPTTPDQLQAAVSGGTDGKFSPFYRCGYSAGLQNGAGNLNGAGPYTSCDYTRATCQKLGMFASDSSGNVTRRFGGIEFVPPSIMVRSYGEKSWHASFTIDNVAQYNDYVPLVYGTAWFLPPVVFARNDGNLTHMEVLLGIGPITDVVKVIVNNIEIPEGVAGTNMTATGWYNVASLGGRNGAFNLDFVDSSGNPLGDPYGSMAYLSVVVPNQISTGLSLPTVEVLVQGLQLSTYDTSGNYVSDAFTNNPAWVLLDVLRRSGWGLDELDVATFARSAANCNQLVQMTDLNGNATMAPRYQCNFVLTNRRSTADIVKGIRTGSALYLVYGPTGLLQLQVEDTLANQQPQQIPGSNSTQLLNGGWPAYEFGDNSFSGIARKGDGTSSLTVWSRSTADSPNRYSVEFQDEFNEYQQDSLSLVETDDALLASQELSATLPALGIPNFDQATRITWLNLNKSVYGNTYVQFETSVRAVTLRPGDIITLTYAKQGWDRQPFRVVQIAPGTNYRTAALTCQIHDDDWYTVEGPAGIGVGRQPGFEVGLPKPLIGSVLDSNGNAQFGITEVSTSSSDGTVVEQLTVAFVAPATTLSTSAGIPLVGLNAQVSTTSGRLSGGQTLYYALTAVDSSGAEGVLSFTVQATIPAGTNTNQVTLPTISLPGAAVEFNVYRGSTPSELLRIASNQAPATSYTDPGNQAQLIGPPDVNFDHANFYWRMELQPEMKADTFSTTTIGNSTLDMLPSEYVGATVRICQGTGVGQERTIFANTSTTLTTGSAWTVKPDATSSFLIADSSWQFGATSNASPVSFDVPNREGLTIDVSGRAANVLNQEAAYDLSPLTSWRIIGAGGSAVDSDVPVAPTFSLVPTGQGSVEIVGVSFTNLNNTVTVNAGTLMIGYWDELKGQSTALGSDVGISESSINLAATGSSQVGGFVQIDSEIMMVLQVLNAGQTYQVTRGAYGSTPVAHSAKTAVYDLAKKIFIMPFSKDFFGSPASGEYAYPMFIPDVRIATAELFMTNSQGNSDVTRQFFTATTDLGLRTFSGGQLTIQIEGMLAIQTNAAPPLSVDESHSVRDVYANVGTAATGSPIVLQVTQNGTPYCQLTIPVGATISNVVNGFALGPLQDQALLGLDILSVTQTTNTVPGSDLTVTIRL